MEQAELKSRLLYSPRSGKFFWIKPPAAHSDLLGEEAGSTAQCRRGKSYVVIQINGRKYRRSHLAFLYLEGHLPRDCVDHINGNSLDDRWQNLRAATVTQNAWNHKHRTKKSDLPMGVRSTASGRFAARIGVKNVQISLGTFDTPSAAEAAYQNARKKYYGEFA